MDAPLADAYWVADGLLLAGRYAGDYDDEVARGRIGSLLDAGIRVVIDLTEPGELPPYHHLLKEEASARGVQAEYVSAPVQDLGVPTEDDLRDVLTTIERAIAARHPVYVHCHGGIGRTGTVVGCWIAQNGYPGEAALERLAELRAACRHAYGRSPETETQRGMVRTWHSHRGEP